MEVLRSLSQQETIQIPLLQLCSITESTSQICSMHKSHFCSLPGKTTKFRFFYSKAKGRNKENCQSAIQLWYSWTQLKLYIKERKIISQASVKGFIGLYQNFIFRWLPLSLQTNRSKYWYLMLPVKCLFVSFSL